MNLPGPKCLFWECWVYLKASTNHHLKCHESQGRMQPHFSKQRVNRCNDTRWHTAIPRGLKMNTNEMLKTGTVYNIAGIVTISLF
jgi:hypothetical protein